MQVGSSACRDRLAIAAPGQGGLEISIVRGWHKSMACRTRRVVTCFLSIAIAIAGSRESAVQPRNPAAATRLCRPVKLGGIVDDAALDETPRRYALRLTRSTTSSKGG